MKVFPAAWTGRWKDEKGVTIVFEENEQVQIFDTNQKPYTVTLLDGKQLDSTKLKGNFLVRNGYITCEIECGTKGLGPVYQLQFVKQKEDGTITPAKQSDPIECICMQPKVLLGLYDDFDDDHGISWAYPLSYFKKNFMNESLQETKQTLESLAPSERLGYLFTQIKKKNADVRYPRDTKLLSLRFFAFCVDVIVMFLPMIAIAIPLAIWNESLALFGIIPALLFMPLYIVFKDGVGGAGLGKRMFGLRVVDANTKQAIGYYVSWLRFVGPVLPFLFFEPFILLYLGDRRLGDVVAHTRVVRKSNIAY